MFAVLLFVHSWLLGIHSQVHSLNLLFKPSITQRAIGAVTNPFCVQGIDSEMYTHFTKQMEEERVDKYVDNPFYGTGIKYDDKVIIINFKLLLYFTLFIIAG